MYKNLLEFNNDKILMDEFLVDETHKINIDEVFEHIIVIYDKTIIQVIFNSLLLIRQQEIVENQHSMISGLNIMLLTYNKKITEWIKLNLVL
jgi:hypothetical protein